MSRRIIVGRRIMCLDLARAIIIGVILTALPLVACSRTTTVAEAVYVPGDAFVQDKLSIAESVGGEVSESGLTQQIQELYPHLTEEQLSGVFLRWETISVTPVTGEGEPSVGVRIRVGIQHRGDLKEARDIAKLCADIVEQALSHRLGTTDIYRLDFIEKNFAL